MRDIETIDSELRLVAGLRRAARERGGPLPSIDEADALDERRELTERATCQAGRTPSSRRQVLSKDTACCLASRCPRRLIR